MINSESDKLFVTHSHNGAVSIYDIGIDGGLDSDNGRIIFQNDESVPLDIMNIIGIDTLKKNRNLKFKALSVKRKDLEQNGKQNGFAYSKWTLVLVFIVIVMNLFTFCYF